MHIIKVDNLVKTYNTKRAVKGISFQVEEGEIFGIIGPNGAGKTTTIECIEGLKKSDTGSFIEVMGLNPEKHRKELYKHIGVQLQETSYPQFSKVKDIARTLEAFYDNALPYKELLKDFQLDDKANSYISTLSGGQRQRLSIALALINNPKIVFLDELTTGLDPQARRDMWEWVLKLKEQGRTVVLTTHYMEEAQYLCDRIAIIKDGEIVKLDSADNIVNSCNLTDKVVLKLQQSEEIESIKKYDYLDVEKDKNDNVIIKGDGEIALKVLEILSKEDIKYSDLKVIKPSLEDAYLNITNSREEVG